MLLGFVALSTVVAILAGCAGTPSPSTDAGAEPRAPDTAVNVTTAAAPTTGAAGSGDLAVTTSGRVAAVSPSGRVRWGVSVDESVRYGPEPYDVSTVTISSAIGPRPRWSPDRRWIAFSAGLNEDEYGVYLVSSHGGSPRALVAASAEGGASGPLDYRWSPSSKQLAYTMQGAGVVVVDLRGAEKVLRLRQFDVWNELWADWLDARRLAVIGVDRRSSLVLVEVDVTRATTRVVATLAPHETDFGAELSGDRRVIAWWTSPVAESAAGALSTIRTDGADRRLVGRFRGLTAAVPDRTGSRLAILFSNGLYLVQGKHPPIRLIPTSQIDASLAPVWNPAYTKLAYVKADGIWAHNIRSTTNSRVLTVGSDCSFDW